MFPWHASQENGQIAPHDDDSDGGSDDPNSTDDEGGSDDDSSGVASDQVDANASDGDSSPRPLSDAPPLADETGSNAPAEDVDDSDSMGTTLRCGVSPYRTMKRDSDAPGAPSSQVKSWWGDAYQHLCRQDKLGMTPVPIHTLYAWWIDGKPSEDEYVGTFDSDDVKCLVGQ